MAANSITSEDLWTALRGCENTLRYQADILGSWMLKGFVDRSAGLDLSPSQTRSITAEDTIRCSPPWCWEYPVESVSHLRAVSERLSAIADAFELIGTQFHVPEDGDGYVSELPGTCWRK